MSHHYLLATALLLAVPATTQSPGWGRVLLGDEAAASGTFRCAANVQNGVWSGACFHPALAAVRAAEQHAERGPAYRERVCQLLADERHITPSGAFEVSASGPLRDEQSLPDSVLVYRLLYVPNSTEASLGISDQDPGDGRPWLHQAGTCTAHIMWSEHRTLR